MQGCIPTNCRVYRKCVKPEMCNMLVDSLSVTLWEALICSPRSQNDGASQWNCMSNSVSLHSSFYRGCRWDNDAPHDTEIWLCICENVDSESVYNESDLYTDFAIQSYISLTITISVICLHLTSKVGLSHTFVSQYISNKTTTVLCTDSLFLLLAIFIMSVSLLRCIHSFLI
jgi:hypothetical protein